MDIIALKKSIPSKYFDYQRLKGAIVGQANERRFIGRLLQKGHIVRVKKGLYVWSPELDTSGYSRKILSNLIYGPSYISLEYALSFYGIIPERVESVTAVTFKKKKVYSSPVGRFEYFHLYKSAYAQGIVLHQINHSEACLIASPEKAILDYIALRLKRLRPATSLSHLLYNDLRCDPEVLAALSPNLLSEYGAFYRSKAVSTFIEKVARWGI